MRRIDRALTIARAALLEVGGDPGDVIVRYYPGERVTLAHRSTVGRRAGMLGALAVYGPRYPVFCDTCIALWPNLDTAACTPVVDALRGVTCETP